MNANKNDKRKDVVGKLVDLKWIMFKIKERPALHGEYTISSFYTSLTVALFLQLVYVSVIDM